MPSIYQLINYAYIINISKIKKQGNQINDSPAFHQKTLFT